MNEQEKEAQETQAAIDAYIADGGKVTVCPAGERTDPDLIANVWTKNKPGRPPAAARKPGDE
jgi:hypothetical protein